MEEYPMPGLTEQQAHPLATWQGQVQMLKETERKLLDRVAEMRHYVNGSDDSDMATRLRSLDAILGYVEESARQMVGLVEAFLRLQEETILQTRAQTLRQVQDELYELIRRLGPPLDPPASECALDAP
jgi:hypothetical protein